MFEKSRVFSYPSIIYYFFIASLKVSTVFAFFARQQLLFMSSIEFFVNFLPLLNSESFFFLRPLLISLKQLIELPAQKP